MACASSVKGTTGHGAEGKTRSRSGREPEGHPGVLTRPASSAYRSMGVINNMFLRRHSQLSNNFCLWCTKSLPRHRIKLAKRWKTDCSR